MNETTEVLNDHTSFGTFKPVGHVLLGVKPDGDRDALIGALRASGIGNPSMTVFTPRETVAEMKDMIDDASILAGFGYEITAMRRLVKLSIEGFRWLLVKVDDLEAAQKAAEVAKANDVPLAWYYRMLTVEELI
jgi:hypothetical protein